MPPFGNFFSGGGGETLKGSRRSKTSWFPMQLSDALGFDAR